MYEREEAEKENMSCGRKTSLFSFLLKKDNFLIMILIGILLLVIVWPVDTASETREGEGLESGNSTQNALTEADSVSKTIAIGTENDMLAYAGYLEETLEEVLSSMDGAGRVKVMVTMESSKEAVLEKDVVTQRTGSTEVDSAGGSRNTTDISREEETIYKESEGKVGEPFIKRMEAPKVEGVLVAAQGGDKGTVAKNITEAIQALFGIEAHKIKIVKMNSQ